MLASLELSRILRIMERRTTYRRTTRLIVLCAALLLGLGWARVAPVLSFVWVILLAVFALITFRKARTLSLYAVIACGFALGWWRGGIYMQNVREFSRISKQLITVSGKALNDSIYDDSQLSFDMGSLKMSQPYAKHLAGRISVKGYGEKMVYRGDEVTVTAKFYPGRGSYAGYLSYSEMHVTGRSSSVIYSITRKFNSGLLNVLPEPQASFAMGLLIGQRNTLPDDLTDTLALVGLSHIVAVSGYNLTVMIRASRRMFGKRSKFQTWLGSQALIIGFLLVTGMSASIVRAAIISSLSLGAWYYGRKVKPLLLILFTAALTAFINPLYVWSDIGWYLSFLAFFGVLILSPLIRARLFRGRERGIIGELMLETICAQIMTLPLVLYIFGTSSFIALPANILVVPLIPLAMLLSFIAGLAGMLIAPVAGWVAWPARIVLTYLLDTASLFARVPNMDFKVSMGVYAMLGMFVAIASAAFIMWRKNAKITDRKTEEQNVRTLQMVNN